MKFFKVLTVVSLFFFFIACEDGSQRFVPVDEVDDGSSEVTDDTDPTDPTEPTNPTDEPTNPTDEPTNPTDEPTNPTDDPTNPTDEPTNPTDDPTNPTDDPTNPTDDPTNPTDDPTNPTDPTVTDEEKCLAETGTTWDASSQSCYRIENCDTAAKPANSEWNGDSSYKVYYDVDTETWVPGPVYETQYGDGEPQPCQYKCTTGYVYANGICKSQAQMNYCSAVFNGESSRVEVDSNDALNLAYETWTIEAWIKQAEEDITNSNVPIVRKGTGSTPAYLLTGYKFLGTYNDTNYYTLMGYVGYSYKQQFQTKTGTVQPSPSYTTYSYGWSHIALVNTKVVSGNQWQQTTTYKLVLFQDGHQVSSKDYAAAPTINTLNEALVIGANLSGGIYFKGLIDSIKISDTAKYTEDFTPAVLAADDDTVAFWDFSGNANESKSGMTSTPFDITYSEDCKE